MASEAQEINKMPLRPDEVKDYTDLQEFAKPYGYAKTIGGSIRQRSWRGLAFHGDGTVKYLHNGAIVARNMSFEGMAVLIRLLGREKI